MAKKIDEKKFDETKQVKFDETKQVKFDEPKKEKIAIEEYFANRSNLELVMKSGFKTWLTINKKSLEDTIENFDKLLDKFKNSPIG